MGGRSGDLYRLGGSFGARVAIKVVCVLCLRQLLFFVWLFFGFGGCLVVL